MAGAAAESAGLIVNADIARGHPTDVLATSAKGASMVVVGSRGHGGFTGMVLGSTSSGLLHHAPCPAVIVPGHDYSDDGRVVVGIDASQSSVDALRWAIGEARRRHVGLDVIHAWIHPGVLYSEAAALTADELEAVAQGALDASLAAVAVEAKSVEVEARLEFGHPVDAIVDGAKGASLIVVGSHGRGGFRQMLVGSVSSGVVRTAPCPSVVVRPID